jgi:hypothetical protein
MRTPTPQPTLLRAGLAALAAAAVLSGCGSPIPGSALPTAGGGAPSTSRAGAEAEPDPTGPVDRDDACRVTLSGRGNIQVSGRGTRAVTRNDVTSLACGDGPLVQVDVRDGGVSFTPEGARAVRIDSGATAQVGDYEITVDEAAGDRAEFVVVPPA